MPLAGSCLCGGVAYEVLGELRGISHCYCSLCRKGHGAERRMRASLRSRDFRWTRGEDLLTRYRYSPRREKLFCRRCGTPIVNAYLDDPERIGLAVPTLDDDPGSPALAHLFVDSKPAWIEIGDDLPQFGSVPDVVGTVVEIGEDDLMIETDGGDRFVLAVVDFRSNGSPVRPGERVRLSRRHDEDGFRVRRQ